MRKLYIWCSLFLISISAHASVCPDPETSSLQWGKIPPPWSVSPFSEHVPQGDSNTRFVQANILIAGLGRGVVCNYQNSIGHYSIWWQVSVKTPAFTDNEWRRALSGFECTTSVESCVFYTGN